MADKKEAKSLKVEAVTFQDPLGANKTVLESEDEGDNSDIYYFSQISPATSKYNNDEDEDITEMSQHQNNVPHKNIKSSKKQNHTKTPTSPTSNNNNPSSIYRHNNIIYNNITPTTITKKHFDDSSPTNNLNNTVSCNIHSLLSTTPITTHPSSHIHYPTHTHHPTHILGDIVVIVVDSPEKHSSLLESYVTFRITTHTSRPEYKNNTNLNNNTFPPHLNNDNNKHLSQTSDNNTHTPNDNILTTTNDNSNINTKYHINNNKNASTTDSNTNNNINPDNTSNTDSKNPNNTTNLESNNTTNSNNTNPDLTNTDNTNKDNTNKDTTINTNTTNNTTNFNQVRRRFNDFVWLRDQLQQQHSTLFIPPLPDKQRLVQKFSNDLIRSRILSLNRFLTRVASHPILSFSHSFVLFLVAKQWDCKELKSNTIKVSNQSNTSVGGVMSKLSQSLYSIGGHMFNNRPIEFEEMTSRMKRLTEKLKMTEKVSSKMLKEQTELLSHVHSLHSCLLLWSVNEESLSTLLTNTSQCLTCQSSSLKGVIDSTELDVLLPLREYVLYVEVVKTVLKRRDMVELEHEQLRHIYSIKKQDHNVTHEDLNKAHSEMEQANDRQCCVEADLRAEFERWTANQRRDLKTIFRHFSENQMKFYQTATAAWEGVVEKSKVGFVKEE